MLCSAVGGYGFIEPVFSQGPRRIFAPSCRHPPAGVNAAHAPQANAGSLPKYCLRNTNPLLQHDCTVFHAAEARHLRLTQKPRQNNVEACHIPVLLPHNVKSCRIILFPFSHDVRPTLSLFARRPRRYCRIRERMTSGETARSLHMCKHSSQSERHYWFPQHEHAQRICCQRSLPKNESAVQLPDGSSTTARCFASK